MSISILPPPSSRPGVARALPSLALGSAAAVPASELKAEAIRLLPLTGLGKRESARMFGSGWSTVKGWLNPLALDRTPPPRFVRWLQLRADARANLAAAERELEAM